MKLVIDFGLDLQPSRNWFDPIEVEQLLVAIFTANRLFWALSMSIQRDEAPVGKLETVVQERHMGMRQCRWITTSENQ